MKRRQPYQQKPYVIRRERGGTYQFLRDLHRHYWSSQSNKALRFNLAEAQEALAGVTQSMRGDKARIVHLSRMMQPSLNPQPSNSQPAIMRGIPIPDSTLLRVIEVMRSASQACADSGLPMTAKNLEREVEALEKLADAAHVERHRRLQEN